MTLWLGQMGFCVLATCISLLALTLTPTAPNRMRVWLGVMALSVILIPIPYLISGQAAPLAPISGALTAQIQHVAPSTILALVSQIIALVFVVSILWMIQTVVSSWMHIQTLKAHASPAPELSALADAQLNPYLKTTRIYRVKDSAIVATSGYLNPVVWVGDKVQGETQLRCALNHEFRHIAYRDQYLLLLIVFLERLQWWNPMAWKIGDLARDAMEHACDDWCAKTFKPATYRNVLAELMLLKQVKPPSLQLNMFQQGKQITRLEKLNMKSKLNAKHGVILVASLITLGTSAISLAELPVTRTLESCHSLLPEGSYELNITSVRNRDSGEIKVSLVDHEDEAWEVPPARVLPFIECVRVVVGIGEVERWPDT